MLSDDEIEYLLKIVIVGDSGVGKTNLINRFAHNKFLENSRNTIGVDFFALDLNIKDKIVKVQFWDTAGEEKYKAIANAYYRNAHGAFVVYDITSWKSFDNIPNWLKGLEQHGGKEMMVSLLGNKLDLEDQRAVQTDIAEKFSQENNLFFSEVSAKTNSEECVPKAFYCLLENILEKQEKEAASQTESELICLKSKTMQVHDKQELPKSENKKSCC